jgi:hypothetical protein
MSKLNYPPILHLNGSGYQNLFEQYSLALQALEECEKHARALLHATHEADRRVSNAFPHGRDYYISQDPNLTQKARDEYVVEVVRKIAAVNEFEAVNKLAQIIDAKEYVHDLLQNVIRQHEERKHPGAYTPHVTPDLVAPAKILD